MACAWVIWNYAILSLPLDGSVAEHPDKEICW